MLQSLKEETEGKCQMLLSLRKNGLTSLFKEVRVFKVKGTNHMGQTEPNSQFFADFL